MHRGEIYLISFSSNGSEQGGTRPAVVVQNDKGNCYSPTTIVVPLTSQEKTLMPTHVTLTPEDCGIIKESTVLCEQIITVDKKRILKKLGDIKNLAKLEDINRKLIVSLALG